jgi:hypothetical protein
MSVRVTCARKANKVGQQHGGAAYLRTAAVKRAERASMWFIACCVPLAARLTLCQEIARVVIDALSQWRWRLIVASCEIRLTLLRNSELAIIAFKGMKDIKYLVE